MNKNAIKKYAVWARNELIARVSFKAAQMGITEKGITEEGKDSVNGVLLTNDQKKQRSVLIARVKEKGFKEVIEETAYTWFNRFIALRYMEVNSLLPSMVRVFTDDSNNFKPQILDEAIHLEFDGLDKDRIYELKDKSDDEELYKYLLIAQCNALNNELPKMFDRLEDYMELLFPDNLLREGSVVEQMVTTIPQEDWQDQVQIIGWMYQYWNIEPKDAVFEGLKKNIKITKENIPAATQLFTPDWIVRYMVENSLGRAWKETHRDFDTSIWKYYLEESPENAGKVAATLENTDLEELTFLDPCMGSGHILVYAFDVFMNLYASRGVGKRDAVRNIITKNIFGIDLDKRAWQLSYFALKMKACQYDANFLSRGIEPNVYYMQDMNLPEGAELTGELKAFAEQFKYADVYGSLTPIKKANKTVIEQINEYQEELFTTGTKKILERMKDISNVLDNKYLIVCTNPPYMGNGGMDDKLSDFIKLNYPDSKTDLFAVFIEKGNELVVENGYNCMVTMQSWMFLNSFEKMRRNILASKNIANLMHMDNMVMGIAFGTAVTNIRNCYQEDYKGIYHQVKFKNINENDVPYEFPVKGNRYAVINAKDFSRIPGSPIAYWVSKNYIDSFATTLKGLTSPRMGLTTGQNEKYLRFWHEVSLNSIGFNLDREDAKKSKLKWFPYNKGGAFRKWYGNQEYVVDWFNDGYEMQTTLHPDGKRIWAHNFNLEWNFKEHLCWNDITSGSVSFRYFPKGFLFDSSAAVTFVPKELQLYLLGYGNTCFVNSVAQLLNPTMHFKLGDFENVPYKMDEVRKQTIDAIVKENITLSKKDWDSFETSWDFTRHPLIPATIHQDVIPLKTGETKPQSDSDYKGHNLKISDLFDYWNNECNQRFETLKANEEELNRIFIDIYGLQDELTPEVADDDVTVRKADLKRDIKSFISYAVGCMLGRYSLSVEGLVSAGEETIVPSNYEPFGVDDDNIIPVCDKAYFDDDIVGRFAKFVEIVYGKETLDENLQFIADAIGGNGKEPMGVLRNYFLNDFYKDHCKMYQNKPIYWMVDAGKKNSFKALIYMHRYNKDTIGDIRTKYVHPHQTRLNSIIEDLGNRSATASGSNKIKLGKELAEAKDQKTELMAFEEKVHHLADQRIEIDLDDGVKTNYARFDEILAATK